MLQSRVIALAYLLDMKVKGTFGQRWNNTKCPMQLDAYSEPLDPRPVNIPQKSFDQ